MNDDDLKLDGCEDIVIDLGDYGAAQETLTLSSGGVDTITITGLDNMASTITLPSNTYSIGGAVGAGSSGIYYTGTTSSYSWANTSSSPVVNIGNDGIDIKEGADIRVDGKSLKEFMSKMEQRLSILVPDPTKLEKFEALKKAYEHYKTMEALCFPEKEEKEN